MSSAGPSRPPPPTSSPLPQPIRRAVRAAQPQLPPASTKAQPQVPPASSKAQIPPKATINPRAKSVFGSFKSLTPNQRILIGLVGIAIGGAGLLVDRFVLPTEGEEKPLIAVRTVDRE